MNPIPNFDAIHQTGLSLVAAHDYYDSLVRQYPVGLCPVEDLDTALSLLTEDTNNLLTLCRDLREEVILIPTKTQLYSLHLNYRSWLVDVKLAANISGGLDQLIKSQTCE